MKHDYRDEQGNKLDPTTGCTLPEPEKTTVDLSTIWGTDVHREDFLASVDEWRRQAEQDREERQQLIAEIQQRRLREAL